MITTTKYCLGFILSLLVFPSLAVTYTYGTYTGNGNAGGQAITGVGFQGDLIFVKAEGAYESWIATSGMGGNARLATSTGALDTDVFTSFDADGFTVQNHAASNTNTVTYYFVVYDDDNSTFDVGSYTGDGSTHSISVGYQPAMVWIFPDYSGQTDVSQSKYAFYGDGGRDYRFDDGSQTSDLIGAIGASGFTTGADAEASSKTYYYATFKEDADMTVGSYNAAGGSTEITAPGIQPDWLMVHTENGWSPGYVKFSGMPTNDSYEFNADAKSTNIIKDFTANGFNCGSSGDPCSHNNNFVFASKGGTALPVDLIDFGGLKIEQKVRLNWSTASETNSSHFEVERSSDGNTFEVIGTVNAAGYSENILKYEFFDEKPLAGNNYYRLKQVDFDDAYEYFKTVVVNFTSGTAMTRVLVYPNPVQDILKVHFETKEAATYQIQIFDQLGSKVYNASMLATDGGNELKVDLMMYNQGYYIIKLIGPNGNTSQMKFFKRD